ncbi:RNA polymerase sigma factor SigJ [Pseudonocardia abyssalis]|jgi:RNA polymerase sigma-70 factor (ECF subfamily)|uniref:RNA polymerase sigma factor SigJ n=2 Tax=Pseudonocardia abyssalis TaxID=2792008 RepID=A0ABS6URG1_9PSEU|nr:RNA polymerase sigma factor SigJ [Pseudonocardia abyssalis]MBW0114291.1 RNA polymerase sigma factor SigJ [Pseudonocardia abyssalis]MBW0134853.1 RNA polymerase sigma factor SigJ [Pseudonocardia abyssalis]
MAGQEIDAEVLGERRHLLSLAFRMLGTVAEAEDVVQETYIRWYRMSRAQRDAVEVPRAWLTRVASRVCLDVLGSARMRRERYVGPWLPEPVPTLAFIDPKRDDPAERATLDESVSTALLVVLESMSPAERVSFVLHDVFAVPFAEIAEVVGRTPAACRQLASSARRRVHSAREAKVSRAAHDATVRAFAAAARAGDLAGLIAVLDPDVVLRSDGGGIVSAARHPVVGADRVARFLLGALEKNPAAEVIDQETPDGLGFALWVEGRVTGVVTMEVTRSVVTDVRMVLNPEKLTFWN